MDEYDTLGELIDFLVVMGVCLAFVWLLLNPQRVRTVMDRVLRSRWIPASVRTGIYSLLGPPASVNRRR